MVADKYRGTLEENRRLYNEVQDLKGNIRVFCRVRPPGATGDATPSAPPAGPLYTPSMLACCMRLLCVGYPCKCLCSSFDLGHMMQCRVCCMRVTGVRPVTHVPRPCTQPKKEAFLSLAAGCVELGLEGELAVYNRRGGARKQFKFDRVFGPDVTQAGVYEDTKFLIRSVLDGARRPSTGSSALASFSVLVPEQATDAGLPREWRRCRAGFFPPPFLGTNRGGSRAPLPPLQDTSHCHLSSSRRARAAQASTCASSATARPAAARRTRWPAATWTAMRAAASTTVRWTTCLRSMRRAAARRARHPRRPTPNYPYSRVMQTRACGACGAQRRRAAAPPRRRHAHAADADRRAHRGTRGAAQAEYAARVQLLEIYNEQLRDLLDEQRSGRRLDIRSTERSGVNVPDAIQARPRVAAPAPAQRAAERPRVSARLPASGCMDRKLQTHLSHVGAGHTGQPEQRGHLSVSRLREGEA